MRLRRFAAVLAGASYLTAIPGLAQKSPVTLDEFFNSVELHTVKISPDGRAVVIETVRPDWEANRFRNDLWLYREENGKAEGLAQLTQSGHDSSPEWSPDGRWIAFLSDRAAPDSAGETAGGRVAKAVKQVYLIPLAGGEAFPVTQGEEEVHAFAWSADSERIYFATRTPWTKAQQDTYRREWNDVVQFRESERGDSIRVVDVPQTHGAHNPEALAMATTPYRVNQLAASPDGRWLAFATDSRTQRVESLEPYGVHLVSLPAGEPRLASPAPAMYQDLHWTADSRHIFTRVETGSLEGKYQWLQLRLYDLEVGGAGGSPIRRWASRFPGSLSSYAVTPAGGLLLAGNIGTETQPYSLDGAGTDCVRRPGWPGAYDHLSAAAHSPRVAFVHSSLARPPEVYLAEGVDRFAEARPITAFNHLFTERALPQGKPYRWTADDGTTVEGMLVYPPGEFGAHHLRMFTFIHGGPDEADGNIFEADWYKWAILAATQGWLVFQPNYRGSLGYGDKFALQTVPGIVSRPGKDILEGVDALVKDGIADPEHLTIGGYSEGGYLTNWLITQTTRFKAAVTGGGAVEHAVNWGNDDETFDDAYMLGGTPWEARKNYDAEAALWQIQKVRTPTHIVAGADDIRVYVGEDYLLERALHTLGVPSKLLIFPGEGHGLDKNPWHGKIKVREELKWLEQYGGR